MDLVTYVLYQLTSSFPKPWLAPVVNGLIWATFAIFLAGWVASEASRIGLKWPYAWALMVAVAPPIFFPLFLWVKNRVAYDHVSHVIARRARRLVAAALIILAALQFFVPMLFSKAASDTPSSPRPAFIITLGPAS